MKADPCLCITETHKAFEQTSETANKVRKNQKKRKNSQGARTTYVVKLGRGRGREKGILETAMQKQQSMCSPAKKSAGKRGKEEVSRL